MGPFSLVLRKGCRGHSPHFPALFPPTSSRTGNNEESLAGEGKGGGGGGGRSRAVVSSADNKTQRGPGSLLLSWLPFTSCLTVRCQCAPKPAWLQRNGPQTGSLCSSGVPVWGWSRAGSPTCAAPTCALPTVRPPLPAAQPRDSLLWVGGTAIPAAPPPGLPPCNVLAPLLPLNIDV